MNVWSRSGCEIGSKEEPALKVILSALWNLSAHCRKNKVINLNEDLPAFPLFWSSLCLFLLLSVSPSLCLSVSLPRYLCLSSLSLDLYDFLPSSRLFLLLSLSISLLFSPCPSHSLCLSPSKSLSLYLSVSLAIPVFLISLTRSLVAFLVSLSQKAQI